MPAGVPAGGSGQLAASGPHLLYIVGQPGSGKSTLVRGLTEGHAGVAVAKPFAHIVYAGAGVVELGARRENFAGTDALSMSVQPRVLAWLADTRPQFVLGEGDRLANKSFLAGAATLGYRVHLVYLAVSGPVAEHRRAVRAAEVGKAQTPSWVQGRITKARRLADEVEASRLNGDLPPAAVLAELLATDDPLAALLASLR